MSTLLLWIVLFAIGLIAIARLRLSFVLWTGVSGALLAAHQHVRIGRRSTAGPFVASQ